MIPRLLKPAINKYQMSKAKL